MGISRSIAISSIATVVVHMQRPAVQFATEVTIEGMRSPGEINGPAIAHLDWLRRAFANVLFVSSDLDG